MIRGFNFKRYKLSQMNIDEETGEILDDQEPKPEDFHESGFATAIGAHNPCEAGLNLKIG
jgi:hypothetical protein